MSARRWSPLGLLSGLPGIGAVVLGLTLASCVGDSLFGCERDEHCETDRSVGVCQPSGYCSFPDGACPSGWRYGDHAPDELARRCVDEDASTSSAGPVGDGTGAITGSGDGGSSGMFTSGAATGSATATSADDSGEESASSTTTTDASTTDASTTDASTTDATTTGDPMLECDIYDDFANGMIDVPWYVWGGIVEEANGMLIITVPAGPDNYGGIGRYAPPFEGLAYGAEFAQPPTAPTVQQMIVLISDTTEDRIELMLEGSQVLCRVIVGATVTDVCFQAHDPVQQRHLRMRESGGRIYFEGSPDGLVWSPVVDIATPFNLSNVRTDVNAGAYTTLSSPRDVGFGYVSLCPA